MKIGTSAKTVALIAGILGVGGLGIFASSASARPKREVRRSTTTVVRTKNRPVVTTRTRTVIRNQPVVRTRTVVRNRPTIIRNQPVVRTRSIVRNRRNDTNRSAVRPGTYTGRVISVSGSSRRFGLHIGGGDLVVLSSSALPRGLSRNDYVTVVGVRSNNTIRSNRVYITRNF